MGKWLLVCSLGMVFSFAYRYGFAKRPFSGFAYHCKSWLAAMLGIVLGLCLFAFVEESINNTQKLNAEKAAAYEETLIKGVFTVTDVEPVISFIPYSGDTGSYLGVMILTEEYPHQKFFIHKALGTHWIKPGERLQLKIDDWQVIEAKRSQLPAFE
jgi:hypothetical protein